MALDVDIELEVNPVGVLHGVGNVVKFCVAVVELVPITHVRLTRQL